MPVFRRPGSERDSFRFEAVATAAADAAATVCRWAQRVLHPSVLHNCQEEVGENRDDRKVCRDDDSPDDDNVCRALDKLLVGSAITALIILCGIAP